jgi:signal transduction histidine kinase
VNEPRASLRLRLFSGVLGAGLVAMALLALVLLLAVRDALYDRQVAAARDTLHDVARLCADSQGPPEACFAARQQELSLLGVVLQPAPCAGPVERERVGGRPSLSVCEDLPGRRASLRRAVPLAQVQAQLASLDARLLAMLGLALALLVLLSVYLLERGVVRKLEGVDAALDRIGAGGEGELLPQSGDALGRLDASVSRLGERLREERDRTRAQIVTLQESNRLLAEEKRALRETRADLARSERLASVGRLAAGVAHEVGNPVTAVIAYAALLRERLGRAPPGPEADYAERIEREAARIDRILRDLLDLARPGPARLESVDLARAVAEAQSAVAVLPPCAGLVVEAAVPEGLAALAEQHYLVQVLVNLFVNAAKAGARAVKVGAQATAEGLVLEVADDGPGIPPEVLPRLFEPFFTTAPPGQGTGLGLALCHATLERFGGSITARAGTPSGAVFALRLRSAPAGP